SVRRLPADVLRQDDPADRRAYGLGKHVDVRAGRFGAKRREEPERPEDGHQQTDALPIRREHGSVAFSRGVQRTATFPSSAMRLPLLLAALLPFGSLRASSALGLSVFFFRSSLAVVAP